MSEKKEITEEQEAYLDKWFIDAMSNPKQFLKQIFSLMLDDETFLHKKSTTDENCPEDMKETIKELFKS